MSVATTKSWTIEIPGWTPTRLNQLLACHWSKANRLKKRDLKTIGRALWVFPVPGASGKRRVWLKITLGPRERGGDVDSYHKVLLDCLVKLSLLVDDSKNYVELAPVEYVRGREKATTILLEDVES